MAHLAELEIPRASGIVDIGSVAFLQFRDPDGNLLMVCAPSIDARGGAPARTDEWSLGTGRCVVTDDVRGARLGA